MDMKHMRAGLRLADVNRWNMVRTIRQQSVLEHSASVAFIAARLAAEIGLCPKTASYWALMHDIDETMTGDIPSHVKKAVKRAGLDMNHMADFEGVPAEYAQIIKIADKIEGVYWLSEYRHGSHSNWVLSDIQQALHAAWNVLPDNLRAAVIKVQHEINKDVKPDFTFDKFVQENGYQPEKAA